MNKFSLILLGASLSLPVFANTYWQQIMQPTSKFSAEQAKLLQQKRQQQQLRADKNQAMQQHTIELLQQIRNQNAHLHGHGIIHELHQGSTILGGPQSPWLKQNPWGNTQKNPFVAEPKPKSSATKTTQQPSNIFVPNSNQPKKNSQGNIFN